MSFSPGNTESNLLLRSIGNSISGLIAIGNHILQFVHKLGEKISNIEQSVEHKGQELIAANDRWAKNLNTLLTYKMLVIDSTYRNRKIYPLPSDFVIPFTNGQSQANSALTAVDPVSLAFPHTQGLTGGLSTPLTIVLQANQFNTTIPNYYINNIIQIGTEFRKIISWANTTLTATVDNAFGVPTAAVPYILRNGTPSLTSTVQVGVNTATTVQFAAGLDGIFVGNFIRFNTGLNAGQFRIISNFDKTTNIATLTAVLTNIPVPGDQFEIDNYSYDNEVNLIYSGTVSQQQPVSYAIQIISLMIPSLILNCGNGGTITNYPYVLVHMYNASSNTYETMYSNNRNAKLAIIRVAISRAAIGNGNFVVIDTINPTTPVVIKFVPAQSIRFKITLPNGEPISFAVTDNQSPNAPNPLCQINATFAIRRVSLEASIINII